MREVFVRHADRPALVDDADYALVADYRWRTDQRGYVVAYKDGAFNVRMHRLITGAGDGEYVDHVDRDGFNNQRANLRLCTHSENLGNQATTRHYAGRPTASRFKGVCRSRRVHVADRWTAKIGRAGERHYLGCFATQEEAARAYDDAAREHFGPFARLNFPHDGEQAA